MHHPRPPLSSRPPHAPARPPGLIQSPIRCQGANKSTPATVLIVPGLVIVPLGCSGAGNRFHRVPKPEIEYLSRFSRFPPPLPSPPPLPRGGSWGGGPEHVREQLLGGPE